MPHGAARGRRTAGRRRRRVRRTTQGRPAAAGADERVRPAPQGRPCADAARQRRARRRSSMPPLRPEDLQGARRADLPPQAAAEFDDEKEADFAIGVPGIGRFRVNVYQQRGTVAFAFRAIAFQAASDRGPEPAAGARADRDEAARARARHRHHRLGQVHGAGRDDPARQRARHANIITIEDPIEFLHRDIKCHINQREVGTRHAVRLPRRCAACCARTPTSS